MDMYIYVFISLLLDNANFDFLEFHSTVTFLHIDEHIFCKGPRYYLITIPLLLSVLLKVAVFILSQENLENQTLRVIQVMKTVVMSTRLPGKNTTPTELEV